MGAVSCTGRDERPLLSTVWLSVNREHRSSEVVEALLVPDAEFTAAGRQRTGDTEPCRSGLRADRDSEAALASTSHANLR